MALILEVLDARGARSWHRLDALPLTLGRGFANDIILDDPYVDARHARLATDETGALHLEDQGSVNGLRSGTTRIDGRLAVVPGAEVRIGRTMLRFHDADEAVPPALVDEPAPSPVPAFVDTPLPPATTAARGRLRRARGWLATTPGQIATVVAATAIFAGYTWLESTDRSTGSAVFTAALGFVMIAALWAGLWSVASRIVVHRFHFIGHLAIIALAVVAMLVSGVLGEWVTFLFPDSAVSSALFVVLALALLAALVAGHLSLASTMPRGRRWRTGLAVSGTVLALGGLGALADDDAFTDVPEFAGVVKPMPARWMPTSSIDEFDGVMKELKDDVDEMAKKKETSAARTTP